MALIKYQDWSPTKATLLVIAQANSIIDEYAEKGFDLTLRQLYYQFVARGWLPNKQAQYDRLGAIINSGRMAGMVDWNAITDRTRNLRTNGHWETPGDIIESAAYSFMLDRWNDQPVRIEVWIEKDALVGVIANTCKKLDVAYFSCRGYTSQSEMWRAGRHRIKKFGERGQQCIILHLGDHDPSGIDMTRDVQDRLTTFAECHVQVERLALNMDQVEELNPPPNPAKLTDSRCKGYIARYGRESWELDALDPEYIDKLITSNVLKYRDEDLWAQTMEREQEMKALLYRLAKEHKGD